VVLGSGVWVVTERRRGLWSAAGPESGIVAAAVVVVVAAAGVAAARTD